MAPDPAARPTAPAVPLRSARRLTLLFMVFEKLLMVTSPKLSDRRFRRANGYGTSRGLEKACLRRVPGGDHSLAGAVAGAVILVFGELRRDIVSAVGRDGDANIGPLILDFADGACNEGVCQSIAWPFQYQAVVAD